MVTVPEGDVLVHAGDCLAYGSLSNLQDFDAWLGTLPHRHKIFVAGNHDTCFEDEPGLARKTVTNATYLEDSGVEIEGFKFWGRSNKLAMLRRCCSVAYHLSRKALVLRIRTLQCQKAGAIQPISEF